MINGTYHERTAAFASGCSKCPYGIREGERIATTGEGWHHVDCAVEVSQRQSRPAPVTAKATLPSSGLDITALDGRYAVEGDHGLAFLRVDAPDEGKWDGWRFVKVQSGDNFDRVGFQKPGATYIGMKADLVSRVITNPMAAMQRYGQEIGACGRCGRTLTDEQSRVFGIGPECRKALVA